MFVWIISQKLPKIISVIFNFNIKTYNYWLAEICFVMLSSKAGKFNSFYILIQCPLYSDQIDLLWWRTFLLISNIALILHRKNNVKIYPSFEQDDWLLPEAVKIIWLTNGTIAYRYLDAGPGHEAFWVSARRIHFNDEVLLESQTGNYDKSFFCYIKWNKWMKIRTRCDVPWP